MSGRPSALGDNDALYRTAQRLGLFPRCNVDLGGDAFVPSRASHDATHHLTFTYSVDHQRQRVHAVGTGVLTIDDFATYIAARVKDGVYDYDQLLDLSSAQLDTPPRELVDAVKEARVHLRDRPIPFTAIVATQGNATYGLARQLATLFDFEGATVQIVDTVAAGNEWLSRTKADREQSQPPIEKNR